MASAVKHRQRTPRQQQQHSATPASSGSLDTAFVVPQGANRKVAAVVKGLVNRQLFSRFGYRRAGPRRSRGVCKASGFGHRSFITNARLFRPILLLFANDKRINRPRLLKCELLRLLRCWQLPMPNGRAVSCDRYRTGSANLPPASLNTRMGGAGRLTVRLVAAAAAAAASDRKLEDSRRAGHKNLGSPPVPSTQPASTGLISHLVG
jgi:hypothetical protein